MKKNVLFIHGAGKGAFDEDKKLAESLQRSLGSGYDVHCPEMHNEEDPNYETWKRQIEKEIEKRDGPLILIGHSMGGSILIKSLADINPDNTIGGIFLIAAPFWEGTKGWKYEGYKPLVLPKEVASKLPKAPIFLYHSRDDENVPFDHLALYSQKLPNATVRKLDERGHQLNNDMSEVVEDILHLPENVG